MEYLHSNRKLFSEVLTLTANKLHISEQIVEKDYYLSLILKSLSKQLPFVVFKGGTSLSKCYQVITRFSEDIDITTDIPLTQGQKQKLKSVILSIVDDMNLSISNLNQTRSRRDYNRYVINYNSTVESLTNALQSTVILETTYTTTSFPVNQKYVTSYIQQILLDEAPDLIDIHSLTPHQMKVQSLERTFIDKIFAICDYYLQNNVTRHSRHFYDLYKLLPLIKIDSAFESLITSVRNERSKSPICVSAKPDVNINTVLLDIIDSKAYLEDYNKLTRQLLGETIEYDETTLAIQKIVDYNLF